MWLSIILTIFPVSDLFSSAHPTNDLGIEIGQKFSELDHEMQQMLHSAKSWTIDNRKYFSKIEAPNTDNCFTYRSDCQPDYENYVYQIPSVHKGHHFTITFSYNYRVLKVEDSFKRTRG